MDLLENPNIRDTIKSILLESDIYNALKIVKRKLLVRHVCYFSIQKISSGKTLQFMAATYSKQWQDFYLDCNYMEQDPIVERASSTDIPFFWSELENQDVIPVRKPLSSIGNGPGNLGFTIPIRHSRNLCAMFSLNHSGDPESWKNTLLVSHDLVEVLGHLIHSMAPQDLVKHYKSVSLSPREIECLIWTAKGKDAMTISRILGISEHTGRDYLKSARTKLGCATIAQAVFIGTKMGIIDY
ncbi:MAG: helix-turn-helix transcriptional regulator [Rhizobiaceae bacterium]